MTSSKGRLEKVLIPLPTVKTQKKIISEMERRDAEVGKHLKQIGRIEARADKIVGRYAAL